MLWFRLDSSASCGTCSPCGEGKYFASGSLQGRLRTCSKDAAAAVRLGERTQTEGEATYPSSRTKGQNTDRIFNDLSHRVVEINVP